MPRPHLLQLVPSWRASTLLDPTKEVVPVDEVEAGGGVGGELCLRKECGLGDRSNHFLLDC